MFTKFSALVLGCLDVLDLARKLLVYDHLCVAFSSKKSQRLALQANEKTYQKLCSYHRLLSDEIISLQRFHILATGSWQRWWRHIDIFIAPHIWPIIRRNCQKKKIEYRHHQKSVGLCISQYTLSFPLTWVQMSLDAFTEFLINRFH